MLAPYLDALRIPGAWQFSLAAVVARFPMSMIGIGIVLLISSTEGAYGPAGLVAAVYVLCEALLAIVQGRLLDRLGQGTVLRVAIIIYTVALGLLIFSAMAGWSLWTTFVAAAVAGATLPQVGSAVRARWAHVTGSARQLQTGFAIESVLDEVVFVVGPVAATTLAVLWHPAAGLLCALLAGLVGTWSFGSLRDTEPPVAPPVSVDQARPSMPWLIIAALALVSWGLGGLFGAVEVATVAFTELHGEQWQAGVVLGIYSLGSLMAGVLSGVITWRSSLVARVRWGALGMLAAMLPLPFLTSIPLLAVVLFAGGFAIAPTLIATMSLAEAVVPAARLTEGLGVLHTGMLCGVAPGAAAAGAAVDQFGPAIAFAACAGFGLCAALSALTLSTQRVAEWTQRRQLSPSTSD